MPGVIDPPVLLQTTCCIELGETMESDAEASYRTYPRPKKRKGVKRLVNQTSGPPLRH